MLCEEIGGMLCTGGVGAVRTCDECVSDLLPVTVHLTLTQITYHVSIDRFVPSKPAGGDFFSSAKAQGD